MSHYRNHNLAIRLVAVVTNTVQRVIWSGACAVEFLAMLHRLARIMQHAQASSVLLGEDWWDAGAVASQRALLYCHAGCTEHFCMQCLSPLSRQHLLHLKCAPLHPAICCAEVFWVSSRWLQCGALHC